VIFVLADSPNKGNDQTFQGAATGTITAAFSPNSGATKLVTDTIHQAKKQILVQAYSFTSPAIAKALADAKARGVDVEVILDKSQWTEKYSGATYLANHKIPVLIDDKHAIAHNKVMIIDGNTVITGSFNFTKAAEEKNAERESSGRETERNAAGSECGSWGVVGFA
jgi:phosphatidylserine/phosphatidylglycerophosphate/cardiolipin synthase-like enzyme